MKCNEVKKSSYTLKMTQKNVMMLSTELEHLYDLKPSVKRHGKQRLKPQCINDYNLKRIFLTLVASYLHRDQSFPRRSFHRRSFPFQFFPARYFPRWSFPR